MNPITLKDFDSLSMRDFENGAVRDAIREALKERERLIEDSEKPEPQGVVYKGSKR